MAGGGVCGAIFKAAGSSDLTKACDEIGHCNTGSSAITPGFNLKAHYIIHTVGPRWRGGIHNEGELLRNCYLSSLELMKKNNCHSICFPLVSAGVYGYPIEEAWKVTLKAILDFIDANDSYDIKILFAILDDNILRMGNGILDNLISQKTQ